jgi:hypothetical protein
VTRFSFKEKFPISWFFNISLSQSVHIAQGVLLDYGHLRYIPNAQKALPIFKILATGYTMLHALCPMLHALCPIAPCPMRSALCSLYFLS